MLAQTRIWPIYFPILTIPNFLSKTIVFWFDKDYRLYDAKTNQI